MALRVCQMRQVSVLAPFVVWLNLSKIMVSWFLNFNSFAGGCPNERDVEQGQSEYDLKLFLVG